uniref:Ig-like domain-containing protein n=1 Tax=Oryzias melastigma TaxID=30732 RepID=A0A3B3DVW5_ORYME
REFTSPVLLCPLALWHRGVPVAVLLVLVWPAAKSVQLGQTVSIDCKVSQTVALWSASQYHLTWYHQKSGEAPKALIKLTSHRFSGISSRFRGSGTGNGIDFTLTISGVQAEDSGVYYCLSYSLNPFWVIGLLVPVQLLLKLEDIIIRSPVCDLIDLRSEDGSIPALSAHVSKLFSSGAAIRHLLFTICHCHTNTQKQHVDKSSPMKYDLEPADPDSGS